MCTSRYKSLNSGLQSRRNVNSSLPQTLQTFKSFQTSDKTYCCLLAAVGWQTPAIHRVGMFRRPMSCAC